MVQRGYRHSISVLLEALYLLIFNKVRKYIGTAFSERAFHRRACADFEKVPS